MTVWSLPYAPHLGLPGPEAPWFAATAARDPDAQLARVAAEGFVHVSDNGLMLRPAPERRALAQALDAYGIGFSSFVLDPAQPPARWADDAATSVAATRERLERSLEAGHAVAARHLTIVTLDEGTPLDDQAARFAANLAWAAPLAKAAGIVLALEPVNPHRLPGVLVTEVDLATRILAAADVPGACLLFDIEHVQHGNGDILAAWDRVASRVGLVQISDRRRQEPGAGDAPIVPFLRHLRAADYAGVIELEHRHSRPGVAGERLSLDRLRAMDNAV